MRIRMVAANRPNAPAETRTHVYIDSFANPKRKKDKGS